MTGISCAYWYPAVALRICFPSGVGEAEDALRLVDRLGNNLYLADNPWIMPPEAVVEAGLSAIKGYLQDVQEARNAGADVTSLNLLKVVLVGSGSAGKTR